MAATSGFFGPKGTGKTTTIGCLVFRCRSCCGAHWCRYIQDAMLTTLAEGAGLGWVWTVIGGAFTTGPEQVLF
jgi:hypothetical protein